ESVCGEHGAGEVEPGGVAGVGAVEDSCGHVGVDEGGDLVGEVEGPGGLSALVVDDGEGVVGVGEAEHGFGEVGAVLSVEPCGAQGEGAVGVGGEGEACPVGFGAAVRGYGVVGRVFGVGLGGGAVKDVVGGELDEGGAVEGGCCGEVAGAGRVDVVRGGFVG